MKIDKVLIANRGEIAVRIMRACREMHISTVCVYSEGDKNALHKLIADEAICIGPAASKDSYLNIKSLIAACEITGAAAIHPGFGFLSENAEFAELCEKCKVKWIGPDAHSISSMGNKANAKKTMKEVGVPVVPGSDGIVDTVSDAKKIAIEIGFPIMIKASAGGGGRGIRLVTSLEEVESAFLSAKTEAKTFFGNDDIYIEKFIEDPRHIEIQLIADEFGNVIYLGERDCSCQRRNQKVLEESPSSVMTEELRKKMGKAAVKAAKSVGYKNAGTVEFLVDKNLNFYFMEMNTRIQVEHPVTEMVTGLDLIKLQIMVASGEKLPFLQSDIKLNGHSIECRLNAENPSKGFTPCPGTLDTLYVPGGNGVRIDSAMYQGWKIPPFYDNMLAKIIVHAATREEARRKMIVALSEFIIEGVDTNLDFLLKILKSYEFKTGDLDIGFINRNIEKLTK